MSGKENLGGKKTEFTEENVSNWEKRNTGREGGPCKGKWASCKYLGQYRGKCGNQSVYRCPAERKVHQGGTKKRALRRPEREKPLTEAPRPWKKKKRRKRPSIKMVQTGQGGNADDARDRGGTNPPKIKIQGWRIL